MEAIKTRISLQRILNTLKIITNSRMSDVDKSDCIYNLKRVSEFINDTTAETKTLKTKIEELENPANYSEVG